MIGKMPKKGGTSSSMSLVLTFAVSAGSKVVDSGHSMFNTTTMLRTRRCSMEMILGFSTSPPSPNIVSRFCGAASEGDQYPSSNPSELSVGRFANSSPGA